MCQAYHVVKHTPSDYAREFVMRLNYEVVWGMLERKSIDDGTFLIDDVRDPGHDCWMMHLVERIGSLDLTPYGGVDLPKAMSNRILEFRTRALEERRQEALDRQRYLESSTYQWERALIGIAKDHAYADVLRSGCNVEKQYAPKRLSFPPTFGHAALFQRIYEQQYIESYDSTWAEARDERTDEYDDHEYDDDDDHEYDDEYEYVYDVTYAEKAVNEPSTAPHDDFW